MAITEGTNLETAEIVWIFCAVELKMSLKHLGFRICYLFAAASIFRAFKSNKLIGLVDTELRLIVSHCVTYIFFETGRTQTHTAT